MFPPFALLWLSSKSISISFAFVSGSSSWSIEVSLNHLSRSEDPFLDLPLIRPRMPFFRIALATLSDVDFLVSLNSSTTLSPQFLTSERSSSLSLDKSDAAPPCFLLYLTSFAAFSFSERLSLVSPSFSAISSSLNPSPLSSL